MTSTELGQPQKQPFPSDSSRPLDPTYTDPIPGDRVVGGDVVRTTYGGGTGRIDIGALDDIETINAERGLPRAPTDTELALQRATNLQSETSEMFFDDDFGVSDRNLIDRNVVDAQRAATNEEYFTDAEERNRRFFDKTAPGVSRDLFEGSQNRINTEGVKENKQRLSNLRAMAAKGNMTDDQKGYLSRAYDRYSELNKGVLHPDLAARRAIENQRVEVAKKAKLDADSTTALKNVANMGKAFNTFKANPTALGAALKTIDPESNIYKVGMIYQDEMKQALAENADEKKIKAITDKGLLGLYTELSKKPGALEKFFADKHSLVDKGIVSGNVAVTQATTIYEAHRKWLEDIGRLERSYNKDTKEYAIPKDQWAKSPLLALEAFRGKNIDLNSLTLLQIKDAIEGKEIRKLKTDKPPKKPTEDDEDTTVSLLDIEFPNDTPDIFRV